MTKGSSHKSAYWPCWPLLWIFVIVDLFLLAPTDVFAIADLDYLYHEQRILDRVKNTIATLSDSITLKA